ncbi:MAG: hypothetical protein Q9181_005032 [Wetmoreana brouardii]
MSAGHRLSPSVSIELSKPNDELDASSPQSVWSDSDNSDSPSRSWVTKGSKMLRKQNSRFNLNPSRTVDWLEESSEGIGHCREPQNRGHNKHGRMWSTGNGLPPRPTISQPYNFRHLTHTQANQFRELRSASESNLLAEFTAVRASQSPQRELQGIRAEDIKSPGADSSLTMYYDPVTPPALSPARSCTSRPGSILSIKNPETLSRSRSIDNFSQPSPKAYRLPQSPTSPPPRTSSRNATHTAPDFFSIQHHATPEEREILNMGNAATDDLTGVQLLPKAIVKGPFDRTFDEQCFPHAITTPDDVAMLLKPPTLRRSTLALADVPEEDELHSGKRPSTESARPMSADSSLRHAKSFPNNGRFSHRRNTSLSRKPPGRPDSLHVGGSVLMDHIALYENDNSKDVPLRRRTSRCTSTSLKSVEAGWEDDIDYCYQHEAEADCEFDWDRVSIGDTPTIDEMIDEVQNAHGSSARSRESTQSVSTNHESLSLRQHDHTTDLGADAVVHSRRLPRLQTSLPDLDFSAASSAKSSMASLRGPVTPLQQLPSPPKVKPSLPTLKSADTLSFDSSIIISPDDASWTLEDGFSKASPWHQSSNSDFACNNLDPIPGTDRISIRYTRPSLNKYHSSESVRPSNPASAAQTRRNTSSGGSLPEFICSKNYRQYVNVTAEQIADRIAALSVAGCREDTYNDTLFPDPQANSTREASRPPVPRMYASKSTSNLRQNHQGEQAPVIVPSVRPQDQVGSVAAFAHRLRSSSVASSASGSSSTRVSRVSYSLFPTVPTSRKQAN